MKVDWTKLKGQIPQIINHFTDTDLYKLSMLVAVLTCFPKAIVRYQFVDRKNRIYPKGFAEEVLRQVKMLENVVITEPEINFLRKRCYFFPEWFYTFLRGFRFKHEWVKFWQDKEGHLKGEFYGPWWGTILLEVMVMAIICELWYILNGQSERFDYDRYYKQTYDKGIKLLENGLVFSDFGTRRRSSFKTQQVAVQALYDAYKSRDWEHTTGGKFVGSSNPWMCMNTGAEDGGLICVGTMAHEWIAGIAGLYGPVRANRIAMDLWTSTYAGSLGIYLFDTAGHEIFETNVTEKDLLMFRGLRVDSGDNYELLDWIVRLYTKFSINAATKQVIFSNALDTDRAIALHKKACKFVLDSYGIGTHFTNDWLFLQDDYPEMKELEFAEKHPELAPISPMEIVIKLIGIQENERDFEHETCKLSDDEGKATGPEGCIRNFMYLLPQFRHLVVPGFDKKV